MKDSVLEEAGLQLKNGKATAQMTKSIHTLAELLVCPLCDKIFNQPTTLASCAHSFCVGCIDQYACKSWTCPVEGCGMPLSITGGHKGSYRKINPQLSQTVESLKLICRSLNTSSDQWWKSPSTVQSIHEMWEEKQRRGTFRQDDEDDSDDDYDNSVRRGKQEREELDSEEVVDLQANLGEDDGRLEDVDCADMASIDSDDSIWDQRN